MNKVFHINLGGYPITIDEDAYEHLRNYLDAIHRHFRQTEGYEEITHDIESRLAELFIEKQGRHPIVSIQTVEEAIAVMGKPEDFGADPMSGGDGQSFSDTASNTTGSGEYRTGKRLFRDPDNKVVGGVCSGLAAYFGIQDPIWVRLFFVIFAMSGGLGVPIYFVIMALAPEAKSASDRLAMRGERINIDNISRIIKEEFTNFSEKVNQLGEEWSGKKKTPPTQTEDAGESHKKWGFTVSTGDAFRSLQPNFEPIGRILRIILAFFAGMFILAFVLMWLGIVGGMAFSGPLVTKFFPGQEMTTYIGMGNLLFILGIPLMGIILLLSRIAFNTRVSMAWRITFGVLWWVNLVSFFIAGSELAKQFSEQATTEQLVPLDNTTANTDTLALGYYELPGTTMEDGFGWTDNGLNLPGARLRMSLRKSDTGTFQLVQHLNANGSTRDEARQLATSIPNQLKISNGTVDVPMEIPFDALSKWRNQHIHLEVLIPAGKHIRIDRRVWEQGRNMNLDSAPTQPYNTFRMEESGQLHCLDCVPG